MELFLIIFVVIFIVFIKSCGENEKCKKTMEIVNKNSDNTDKYIKTHDMRISKKITYKDIANRNYYCVMIDNLHQQILICNKIAGHHNLIKYDEVIGLELQEDGIKTNGVSRAIVGGVLAGEAGAIIGAVTSKKVVKDVRIMIYLSNVVHPQETILISHDSNIKADSETYKNIITFYNELQATMKAVMNETQNNKGSENNTREDVSCKNADSAISVTNSKEKNLENDETPSLYDCSTVIDHIAYEDIGMLISREDFDDGLPGAGSLTQWVRHS